MISMTENEYQNIANESLEELKKETPQTEIKIKHREIQTR
jgi:hypothetical protein